MKFVTLVVLPISFAAWAQAPAARPVPEKPAPSRPAITPETVVAGIDGKPVTAGELTAILRANPAEAQKNFLKNGKAFVEQLALMRKLAAMAEKAHLDQQS